ncbi:hypothetical protein PHBOTO_004797 [Pseudozyma hubeiensis]|nr:hypothetical protein PHBOTO_004797 [Pseudozyma hubeiensis]
MDPAFSLADELADLHTRHDDLSEHLPSDDDLAFHPHHTQYALGSTLGDEFATMDGGAAEFGSLDAELEGLHLHGHGQDLASELGSGGQNMDDERDGFAAGQEDIASVGMSRHTSGHTSWSSGQSTPPRLAPSRSIDSPTRSVTSIPTLPPSQDISSALHATQSFLDRLSSLSSTKDPTTRSAAVTDASEGEDTARLESAAARYLTLISQSSMEREAQLRELRELDRKLERDLPAFNQPSFDLSASSSLSTLPELEDPAAEESLDSSTDSSLPHHRRHRATSSIGSDSTIIPPTSSGHLLDTQLFAPLYTSTLDLVSSLNGLHEHSQVMKSSTADATRKAKTVRGLIGQWKAEVESVEVSEARIRTYEEQELGKRGDGWVREQVEWCRRRIEDVEGRARVLLTPVGVAAPS